LEAFFRRFWVEIDDNFDDILAEPIDYEFVSLSKHCIYDIK
jgi:hypothetical protein